LALAASLTSCFPPYIKKTWHCQDQFL
jgi:hypothetical protein